MNTHYVPQFLLEHFRREALLELDMETGMIKCRSVPHAGSAADLWPEEIENGIMRELDNTAARILRAKVWGKSSIHLISTERHALARWLLLIMARVPISREVFRQMRDAFDDDPELAVRAMQRRPREWLEHIRLSDPEKYKETIATHGEEKGERTLLDEAANQVRRRQVPYLPDPAATHHRHLQGAPDEVLARRLERMHWTWYRTRRLGFCIGDNPFCRWDVRTGRPVYNVADRREVEITFPVSTELTLCITKTNHRQIDQIVECNRERTRQFNHRQRRSALRTVYGCSRELLNPPSRHGFDAPLASSLAEREVRLPDRFFEQGKEKGHANSKGT